MKDLNKAVWKSEATAACWRCDFRVDGVWLAQAGRRARKHTRDTGHVTEVHHDVNIEYRPDKH